MEDKLKPLLSDTSIEENMNIELKGADNNNNNKSQHSTLSQPLPSFTRRRGSKWFPDLNEEQADNIRLQLAAVYLKDAVHARSPNLRIQYKGEWERFTPLQVYRLVHRKKYRLTILFFIAVLFLLTIWETPTLHEFSGHLIICPLIELICLFFLLIDSILRWYSHDDESPYVNMWARVKWIVLLISIIECFITISIHGGGVVFYRVWRITRPFFLIEKGRQMRQVAIGILETIPKIMNVCLLIACHVFFFGFAGFILFSSKSMSWASNRNFTTLEDSFLNLFILLTTANYPDVMMDSYSKSNWSAIYYISFLAFGLFFLFNLVLAVVYENFQNRTKKITRTLVINQKAALCAAFDVLALGEGEKLDRRYIDWHTFREMHQYCRPKEQYFVSVLIFYALDSKKSGKITLKDWERLVDYVDIKFTKTKPLKSRIILPWSETVTIMDRFHYIRRELRKIFRLPYTDYALDFCVFLNALVIVMQLDLEKKNSDSLIGELNYGESNSVFLVIFIIEAVLKIISFGLWTYLKSGFNRLDLVVVTVGFLGWVVPGLSSLQSFTLFRLLRLVRIVRSFRRFYPYFYTIRQISPALIALAGVLFCAFYAFSILGMQFFGMVITRDKEQEYLEPLTKTGWIPQNYWENNFNDILHSLVTLWELMVVNNWYIIMNSYAAVTNRFARLYFVAFFFATVMVVLNCVVAFIIEAFSAQYTLLRSGTDKLKVEEVRQYAKDLINMNSSNDAESSYFLAFDKVVNKLVQDYELEMINNWKIIVRRRTPQLYLSMFESELGEEMKLYMKKMWTREVDLRTQMENRRQQITQDRLTRRSTVNKNVWSLFAFMTKKRDMARLIVHPPTPNNEDFLMEEDNILDSDNDDDDDNQLMLDSKTGEVIPIHVGLDDNY